ncbi:hypothetical protein [Siccirubricoccus deserti]|uniref:Uncharacterized protein n=1 Tax=Siccirubricoccus deserti TaxID=2013562 RepID=A0A9X0UGR8_9PROT|nr:hypothetical protein [Siccirubricoccus deserti]MBC4019243.1 hypothetical protein [Siccirubricoccus deserti]
MVIAGGWARRAHIADELISPTGNLHQALDSVSGTPTRGQTEITDLVRDTLDSVSYMPPADAEARDYAQLEPPARAA